MHNSINFKGQVYIDNRNGSQLPSFRPYSRVVQKLCHDTFIKFDEQNKINANKELERLFPNGELNKIYNNIAETYGLEHIPPLGFSTLEKNTGGGYCAFDNKIELSANLISDSTLVKKIKIEFEDSNGKKISTYLPSTNKKGELIYASDKFLNSELRKNLENHGIKTSLESVSDNDSRRVIIKTLAHELRHAYQYQQIFNSEGLDFKKSIYGRTLIKEKNLIKRKLNEFNYANDYNNRSPWAKYPPKSIYKKGSSEWEFNAKLCDSLIHYSNLNDDGVSYDNNFSEIDANMAAEKYTSKNYPEYNNYPTKEELDALYLKLNS